MHERIVCDTYLERQHLVKRLEVSSLVQHVETQSEADREIGASRTPRVPKFPVRSVCRTRGVELVSGIAPVVAYDVVFGVDVGAAVVHAVHRQTRAELVPSSYIAAKLNPATP